MITTTLPVLRLGGPLDMRDQGSLAIVDLSTYAVVPASSNVALQVTPPGWPTINVPFNPGQVNVYKCGDFGITCDITDCCPLPDGIYSLYYTVRALGIPIDSISKTIIKVDQLDCRIANLFLKIDLECGCPDTDKKKYKQQYREVCLLRDGAVAAANDCDDLGAYKKYNQADKYIDRIYAQFCPTCSPIPSCENCS